MQNPLTSTDGGVVPLCRQALHLVDVVVVVIVVVIVPLPPTVPNEIHSYGDLCPQGNAAVIN